MEDMWTNFMCGDSCDVYGRTIEEILNFDDSQLEEEHKYIQWLFPNYRASRFTSQAPTLTGYDVWFVRNNKKNIKKNIMRSLKMMLYFYGFNIIKIGSWVYIKHDNHFYDWMRPHDHNHLRISRILHFLRAVGMDNYARALYSALLKMDKNSSYVYFTNETMKYWKTIMD